MTSGHEPARPVQQRRGVLHGKEPPVRVAPDRLEVRRRRIAQHVGFGFGGEVRRSVRQRDVLHRAAGQVVAVVRGSDDSAVEEMRVLLVELALPTTRDHEVLADVDALPVIARRRDLEPERPGEASELGP